MDLMPSWTAALHAISLSCAGVRNGDMLRSISYSVSDTRNDGLSNDKKNRQVGRPDGTIYGGCISYSCSLQKV